MASGLDSDPSGGSGPIDDEAMVRLRRIGGDKLLRKILDLYVEQAPGKLERAKVAALRADTKEVEELAHSLKSMSANVGATRMQKLAARLEQRTAAGRLEGAHELLRAMTPALDKARAALTALRPPDEEPSQG